MNGKRHFALTPRNNDMKLLQWNYAVDQDYDVRQVIEEAVDCLERQINHNEDMIFVIDDKEYVYNQKTGDISPW